MKQLFLSLILLLSIQYSLYAQRVDNVVVTQQDKNIVVAYDLLGLAEGQTATVSLYCSEDGGNSWGSKLRYVIGDVGEGIKLVMANRLFGNCLKNAKG